MKLKKYILIILILLMLATMTSIHATENNTNINDINENLTSINEDQSILETPQNNTETPLKINENQDPPLSYLDYSNGAVYNTQLTLTVKNSSSSSTTQNVTINLHLDWDLYMSQSHYNKCQIQIYENSTIIKTIKISDQNLEYIENAHQTLDTSFAYTVKDKTELQATLLQINSNTLSFEEQKNINLNTLKNNTILINNINYSNENWTNQLKYLKKAINDAPTNSIIHLNNITFLNDENITITIDKNITIIGENCVINGMEHGTIFKINPQAKVALINLTFTNILTDYIIKNHGNLKITNNNFNNNIGRIIINNGELQVENTIIKNTTKTCNSFTFNIEDIPENGLIYNTKTLILKNTTLKNIELHQITTNNKNITWDGVIVNKNKIIINSSKFININFRTIYNDGICEINNAQLENITVSNILSYKTQYIQRLDNSFTSISYEKTSRSFEGGAIYNTNNLTITNTSFKNIQGRNGGAIYNTNECRINGTTFHTITGNNGGAIYNTKQTTIINTFFKSITGNDGGAIYNTNNLTITNTTFHTITGSNGGTIYNINQLSIENSIFNNSQSKGTISEMKKGGSIYTTGKCNINNSTITESKIVTGYGGGICNEGTLIMNNTIISKCSSTSGFAQGAGTGIHNSGIMTINNSQIINNTPHYPIHITKYVEQPTGEVFTYITNVYAGVISNSETGKATITKTIIKDNKITPGSNGNWKVYYGTIKNNGNMELSGCIFDNNTPVWNEHYGGEGSFNIYNNGKITVMYSYLLNTEIYIGFDTASGRHSPQSFLFNIGTSTINYNFYCLNPSSIIKNAETNYYFIPSFEYEYCPIKLNENKNITLTLALTNGVDKIEFNDWNKLLTPGLNATITTINENGEYVNITLLLKDKYTFNFNYTHIKAIYTIYANILNHKNTAIVDIGKEYPEMTVTYNNITYNDGNNITFHVKITGNTTPTGNITLTYNNKKVTLNLTDGECNYTINETLKPANYTMRIDYNGDDDYFRVINQYYPFTVHKIPTNITITAKEIKVDQKGEITITVAPDTAMLKGYLYLTKGDKVRKFLADTQGSRTLNPKNFEEGIWNATVIFEEDEYYLGGSASTLFIVSRYTTNITLSSRDVKEGEATATVNITITPGDVRGEAILEINGVNQTIFINKTITPITITDLKEGTYQVNIYYLGDNKYLPSNATTTFSVARITSKLNVEITFNENLTGIIHIQTNYRNCTGEVGIYINNDLTILNLTEGEITTSVKFKRGTNYIYIHYNGDNYYSISNWSATKFLDGKPQMTLETTTLLSNQEGYIRIILKDIGENPYEYTDITLEFNNQTITLKTDENGTIYYPVKVSAGTYTAKATYNTTTVTKTLTVKVPVKITVQIPNVSQDDDLMVYATLTSDEKINDNVILEINGQYYKVIITDGVGSRNLGEFKTGQYTFNAIYPGTQLLTYANTTGTFNVAKNNYKITGNTNIVQYYGATKYYKIRLTNNNQPVKGEIINIKINKNTVQVKTDSQGYATLKLSLKAGKYTITSTYKNIKVSNKITVKPTLITKNKKIKKGKTLTYTAKLLNKNGKKLKNKKITFKINGKKYKAKTNKKGIAKIKVKNLKKGKYKIKTSYGKQKNTNTITVK